MQSPSPHPLVIRPNTKTARYYPAVLLNAFLSICIVMVWLRNRDVLRDMFDYSIIVAAVGKIEAGLKPYADVRSPMQSAVYLFNYFTEGLFGRNYLALTVGGLVQALGGGLVLSWMLQRRMGAVAGTLLAAAVAMAGLIQHVVFFYNPIGILCFSLVLLGLAIEPWLWPARSATVWLILGALFVSGINKLNFHGATLLLAGLMTLAGWTRGTGPRRGLLWNLLLLALFGGVLPLAFELAWTGATPAQWFHDVVLLPTARHELLRQVFSPGIYLRPVYDFHHHVLVGWIGGLGLGLLLVTGAWLLYDARESRATAAGWLVRLALIIVGGVMCALIMITSHETVMLTSLSYLVVATAWFLPHQQAGRAADRWLGGILSGAALLWALTGGYAAWHGSRVLYALDPPARDKYVPLRSAAPALAYFAGVKMPAEQIDALGRIAARLKAFEDHEGRITGFLFGPAVEWLERAYPDAIVRHAPVWYDAGTTLGRDDTDYFRGLLGGGTSRLLTHRFWQAWPPVIKELLERDYRKEEVGSRDLLYHPRGPVAPPVLETPDAAMPANMFRYVTNSTVLLTATRYSAGMALRPRTLQTLFGARRDSSWHWPLGALAFQGQAVAELPPESTGPGRVTFRVMAGDPEHGKLLWEVPASLTAQHRKAVVPLSLQSDGQPLWFQIVFDDKARGLVLAGWREFRITQSNERDLSVALPFSSGLQQVAGEPADRGRDDRLWYARGPEALLPGGWIAVPAERWRRHEARPGLVRVQVRFDPDAPAPADPVILTLAWYRAGRFEIMTERMVDLRETRSVTLQAPVTEPGGWVGLLSRGGGGTGAGVGMRIAQWRDL